MINDRRIKTSLLAILTDIILTAMKASLAVVSGSAALLADAYHSATDLIVSIILLVGIVIRNKQESKGDEQGIFKARRLESWLAILVACIILYVPFEIVQEIKDKPVETLENLWIAIVGTLLIIAMVFFISRLKTHVGKQTDSPALEADGYHSMVDVFTSIAVLLSLVGYMVGVYLDDIVAVLIAVMIAVSGIELLVSGFRSLVRGTELDQFSLADVGVSLFKHVPLSDMLIRQKYALVTCLVIIYLASGVKQVPYGYIGVQKRFGQTIGDELPSGLHYMLPWPFEQLTLLEDGFVMATSSGSATVLNGQSRLWRALDKNLIKQDATAYIVTGDEKLIDLLFTLQYRISEPLSLHQNVNNIDQVVHHFVSSSLMRYAAMTSIDKILYASHLEFADLIADNIQMELSNIGIAVEIVDAQITLVQPPAGIVRSYRDVLNAGQERQQLINREIAKRLNDLPIANAEVIEQTAEVKATAAERMLMAEGDVEYSRQLAEIYKSDPDAFQFNRYIETLANTLEGKPLTLVDSDIDPLKLRAWMQESHENGRR